jgi:hypothetical protein
MVKRSSAWNWARVIRRRREISLRRSATNSPHVTSVLARAGSPRRKMPKWRFAFFREPSWDVR